MCFGGGSLDYTIIIIKKDYYYDFKNVVKCVINYNVTNSNLNELTSVETYILPRV